jgi:hypothetical protein
MRYCPLPSLMVVRTFSISAGLLASTVTPGSTAPEVSLTEPAMTAWARATVGTRMINATIASVFTPKRICHLSFGWVPPRN